MRRPTLWLVPILALVLTAAAVVASTAPDVPGTPAAEARRRISIPFGFESVDLRHNGRQVIVTAPVGCGPGGHYRLDVRIEQDGVAATGHRQGPCTSEVETVTVRAVVHGRQVLHEGPAHGEGEFRVFFRGERTDFVAWEWNNQLD